MMCGDLVDPAFGSVSHSGTSLGTVAEYSCDSGYLLSGNRTRTCLDPGIWSGNAPTCEREYSALALCFQLLVSMDERWTR